ncbi:MAG: hypothetical protein UY35_C0026G0006 [Candidatus Saccharibacteria bacterium GW2011_GWC2_48_9]|nr:MAG: hypothetical protein UY35_C0026G0006 [Candidatus Saccharibacteria bacterium GW2011_GWC2_48_9]HCH34886.1 hypothetical protein [Candidatus Saccharibacteria bacterium]
MDPTVQINERVDIVPIFHADAPERLVCVPWKMRFRNQEIVFTIFGMRHPTAQGRRMIHVFEMSDGANDYRVEFDAEHLTWTLVSMVEGRYVGV